MDWDQGVAHTLTQATRALDELQPVSSRERAALSRIRLSRRIGCSACFRCGLDSPRAVGDVQLVLGRWLRSEVLSL